MRTIGCSPRSLPSLAGNTFKRMLFYVNSMSHNNELEPEKPDPELFRQFSRERSFIPRNLFDRQPQQRGSSLESVKSLLDLAFLVPVIRAVPRAYANLGALLRRMRRIRGIARLVRGLPRPLQAGDEIWDPANGTWVHSPLHRSDRPGDRWRQAATPR